MGKQYLALFFCTPKSLQMVIAAMKLKDTPWKESYDQPRQHIKKQRHYFIHKCPSIQGYDFSSGHVWMWELDYKESWAPKNWCFWTVVLEKTAESPLDCKEIQPVHPRGDQSWVFIGRIVVEAETPILWPPDTKSWLIWKDPDTGKYWGQEEKGMIEDEMAVWHHRFDEQGFGWTPGVDGQGGLECCSSWGHKESDMTELMNWTELKCLRAGGRTVTKDIYLLLNVMKTSLPVTFCKQNTEGSRFAKISSSTFMSSTGYLFAIFLKWQSKVYI